MTDRSRSVILGVHLGHDGTAALVVDGRVTMAVAEERISRIKGHLGFPHRAIALVLAQSGVDPSEVDAVATSFADYSDAPPFLTRALLQSDGCPIPLDDSFGPGVVLGEIRRQLREDHVLSLPYPATSARFRANTLGLYRHALAELGICDVPIQAVNHHLSHAASAYFTAPFAECVVVTADGAGDGHSSSWNQCRDGMLKSVEACPAEISLGKFYAAVTKFLGFTPNRHEGKVTGLAARGDPERWRKTLDDCIQYDSQHRQFRTRIGRFPRALRVRDLVGIMRQGYFRDAYTRGVFEFCEMRLKGATVEDVAAATQAILEDCMCQYFRDAAQVTGSRSFVCAGGLFANVRMNHAIAELPEVEALYIHPNMGDGGTALGAALQLDHLRSGLRRDRQIECFDPYLGSEESDEAFEASLTRRSLPFRRCANIEEEMAKQVAGGKILGRYNGRMEYGPRALGNRSVLADPRSPEIHERLNQRLHRSEFMPFAPSILEERAEDYLLGLEVRRDASRYMTICFEMEPSNCAKIPGVCHVDGTARAHLVTKEANPSYHKFLTHFERETGLPLVLNTSLNNHEEPIVGNPDDAIRLFEAGALDVLALGPFLVDRPASP